MAGIGVPLTRPSPHAVGGLLSPGEAEPYVGELCGA